MTAPPSRVPEVRLTRSGARRFATLHPWIFKDDVAADGGATHGDVVRVVDETGRPLGSAFWSAHSKIALRRVASGEAVADSALWAGRVSGALERRGGSGPASGATRLIFGESDGLPGIVADRYGAHLVVQVATAGAERILPTVIEALRAHLPIASVLLRNDAAVRALEGLDREVRQLDGTTPETIEVDEGGVTLLVDPWRGQKTGLFLDQAGNRIAAREHARGRVLDAFGYQGAFGLQAARGADEVVVLDASAEALARARENAARNGFRNVSVVEANAFDDLRERVRRRERFDLVLLDPPAFAKGRRDLPGALRGYKEVNLRAMRLVAPGGVLVTSSCSYPLDEPAFEQVLRHAAVDAGRPFEVLSRRGQAADHPVLLSFPESRYLKCFILRDAAGRM